MRNYIPLIKEIDLSSLSDRRYLFKLLRSISEFDSQIEEIKRIVRLFNKYLSAEWLKFLPYPFEGVKLEIESKKSITLNFVDDIIPLGQALLKLQRLAKFQQLIEKLNTKSHDRLAAVMEAIFSAKYKKVGYPVCLEPSSIFNRCADFKAKLNEEWIFFECKAENYYESESFKQNIQYNSRIENRIKLELQDISNIAIELWSKRKITDRDLVLLIDKIKNEIQRNNFDNRINHYGLEFVLHKVNAGLSSDIQIGQYVYSGTNIDKRRLGKLLNSAKDQLHPQKKGIIIVKARDKKIAVPIAEDKIKRIDYRHISAIVVIESVKGKIVLNENAAPLSQEFINISLSRPLPSYWV